MLIVPPGSGIVHQVNLEYLARVVFEKDGLLYPDSVVGTDSHTTMINGLGKIHARIRQQLLSCLKKLMNDSIRPSEFFMERCPRMGCGRN